MTMLAVGATAPDFALASTAGTDVTLSAHRGKKVLLAFFPEAFTSVCTAEMCAFSEDYGAFQDADTVVLPISVDQIPSLKAFKASERMTVDFLSDMRREVSRAYGTLSEERYNCHRAYVLIDRDGVIRWTFSEVHPGTRRENAELLEQLQALP